MLEKIKNLFKEFTNFLSLNISSFHISLLILGSVAGFGFLIIIVTFLSEVLKTLHSLNDHFVVISTTLQESQTELLRLQEEIANLKKDIVSPNLEQSSFFSWKNAVIVTGVGIFAVVLVSSAILYKDHQMLNDLWKVWKD